MKRGEEIIQEKMRMLIDESCRFEKSPNQEFREFHKAYFKFCFNAVQVEIDYNAQEIYSSNSKPLTTNPVRLFDMNQAVADKFSYSDLEETLVGCIDDSHLHYLFYKKMLMEFGGYSKEQIENYTAEDVQ